MTIVVNKGLSNQWLRNYIPDGPLDGAWFRDFAVRYLVNADVRNATAGSNVTITGNIGTPATISATGGSASPLTTKGDLYGYDTGNNRIPVGSNGQVLTADSTQALGLKWATPVGTPTALTPATINGLLHWFESDTIATPSGSNVTWLIARDPYRAPPPYWLGTANISSSTAPLSGPTVDASTLNGLPVLSFPGTSAGNMIFPAGFGGLNLGATNGACTIFAVLKPNLSSACSLLSGASGAFNLQIAVTTGTINVSSDFVAVLVSSSTPLTGSVWQQFNVTYSNATGAAAFRVARASAGSGTNVSKPTSVVTAAFYNSAAGASVENYTGLFAALIIYGRVLTAGEITSVENYILAKYGV